MEHYRRRQLETQDALLNERFFPFGSQFDAYQTIKSILNTATNSLSIIDGYAGGVLFQTLSSIRILPYIRVITSNRFTPDFRHEARLLKHSILNFSLEIRVAYDFHDRFVVVDEKDYYHIGASIKDAGKKAFLISKLADEPVKNLLHRHIELLWSNAIAVI